MAVNGVPSAWQIICCGTFLSRARGRLATTSAQIDRAWWLQPCRAVHTFFLSEPIDVVFCDADDVVVRIVAMLRPWRCAVERAAASTWEFPAGAAVRMGLRCGDRLTACR
jgi:uncharacterized protein